MPLWQIKVRHPWKIIGLTMMWTSKFVNNRPGKSNHATLLQALLLSITKHHEQCNLQSKHKWGLMVSEGHSIIIMVLSRTTGRQTWQRADHGETKPQDRKIIGMVWAFETSQHTEWHIFSKTVPPSNPSSTLPQTRYQVFMHTYMPIQITLLGFSCTMFSIGSHLWMLAGNTVGGGCGTFLI